MRDLPIGPDAWGVRHIATYAYPSKRLSMNPACYVLRRMDSLARITRLVDGATPTCLWCVVAWKKYGWMAPR